jgi:hypothetical protein
LTHGEKKDSTTIPSSKEQVIHVKKKGPGHSTRALLTSLFPDTPLHQTEGKKINGMVNDWQGTNRPCFLRPGMQASRWLS